jgi:hypothetical protein
MSALYWADFDCTEESRAIQHPSTVHVHTNDEQEACRAYLNVEFEWPAYRDGGVARYRCVRGPKGLVRGVRW